MDTPRPEATANQAFESAPCISSLKPAPIPIMFTQFQTKSQLKVPGAFQWSSMQAATRHSARRGRRRKFRRATLRAEFAQVRAMQSRDEMHRLRTASQLARHLHESNLSRTRLLPLVAHLLHQRSRSAFGGRLWLTSLRSSNPKTSHLITRRGRAYFRLSLIHI